MRIKLNQHDSVTVELDDGTTLKLSHFDIKRLQADPQDVTPEDGFFISLRERDWLSAKEDIPGIPSPKISAIKGVRERTGMGVKAAKMHVEAYQATRGLIPLHEYRY